MNNKYKILNNKLPHYNMLKKNLKKYNLRKINNYLMQKKYIKIR